MNANTNRKSITVLAAALVVGAMTLSRLAADESTAPAVGLVVQGGSHPGTARTIRANVAPVKDALLMLEQLRGVTFDEISDYGSRRRMGFIAADMAEVLPEAVETDEYGRPGSICPTSVLSLAIESIRELHAETAALRTEVTTLHGEIRMLRARMAQVEQALKQPQCGTNDTPELED